MNDGLTMMVNVGLMTVKIFLLMVKLCLNDGSLVK